MDLSGLHTKYTTKLKYVFIESNSFKETLRMIIRVHYHFKSLRYAYHGGITAIL